MEGMDFILYIYVFKSCGFPIIYFMLFAINGETVKPILTKVIWNVWDSKIYMWKYVRFKWVLCESAISF